MTWFLISLVLLCFYSCSVEAQIQCPKKNGVNQNCILYTQCEFMMKIMQNPTPANQAIVRQAFCGWRETTPMVCCPSSECITPDGAQGTCIPPSSCAHIVRMAEKQTPIPESTRRYIQSLRCEGTEQYNVCCSPPKNTQPTAKFRSSVSNEKCILTAVPPEPSTGCCGRESNGGGNRIFGGNETAIDEYPWLAVIEYHKGQVVNLYCGGTLISGRYVLTAAHCLVGDILTQGTPVNVRLGEYDTSNSGPDCVEVEGGGTDCTDGAVIVPIETTIPHPEYRPRSVRQTDDIGLIRLDRVVEYTAFIRPICLPSIDFTKAPTAGLELFTAGWGAISIAQSSSKVKLAVALPYISNEECEPAYNKFDNRMRLWDGQICAGGGNKDTCRGDSGGPLLRPNGNHMEIVGIVSVGVTPCGWHRVPGIYTYVYKYLPWIRSHFEEIVFH